jgi:hypothetical protein
MWIHKVYIPTSGKFKLNVHLVFEDKIYLGEDATGPFLLFPEEPTNSAITLAYQIVEIGIDFDENLALDCVGPICNYTKYLLQVFEEDEDE